jgi:Raf kinase inhibitor-like YbhB/YbcL family protein
MKKYLIIISLIFLTACLPQKQINFNINNIGMKITSAAFKHNQTIPFKYTCDGENISPPLAFADIPENTRSLVLIIDDPDASAGYWIHWLVWNIDPKITQIIENSVPQGAIEGITSFSKPGYGGPCPPSDTHRYFFKLYALDIKLELTSESKKEDIEQVIQGHILDSAELIGLYQRQ